MTKRAWILGVVAVSATLSSGCSTLPSTRGAHEASVEEVDVLADVELTDEERATLADGGLADAPVASAQRENSTEVSWQPNGKNIQLAKLPPVTPVTASMLQLDKRAVLLTPAQAKKTGEGDAPTRGRHKSSPAKE